MPSDSRDRRPPVSHRARRRGRRGFTLPGMVAYAIMLSAVLMLLTEIIGTAHRATRAAEDELATLGRFDALAARLRRDVWSATRIECPSPTELRLALPPLQTVTWTRAPDGTPRREVSHPPLGTEPASGRPDDAQTFPDAPAPTFRVTGPRVEATFTPLPPAAPPPALAARRGEAVTLTLVSQPLLQPPVRERPSPRPASPEGRP